jgi:hypothetical protein
VFPEEEEDEDERGLRSYEIDEDTVRVNNPDPNEPDKIVRRLADGSVKSYDVRKQKDS